MIFFHLAQLITLAQSHVCFVLTKKTLIFGMFILFAQFAGLQFLDMISLVW